MSGRRLASRSFGASRSKSSFTSLHLSCTPSLDRASDGCFAPDARTGVRVVVIGIPPVDEASIGVNLARLISNAKIAQINVRLASLCSQYSNCEAATAAMQFNMSGKTLDGLHPKPETYAAWTTVLAQYLE
jgi:hypothetical protein